MFTLAVLGSSLYGAMTVASAWVIGGVTEQVLLPAFADGATTAAALALRPRRSSASRSSRSSASSAGGCSPGS